VAGAYSHKYVVPNIMLHVCKHRNKIHVRITELNDINILPSTRVLHDHKLLRNFEVQFDVQVKT